MTKILRGSPRHADRAYAVARALPQYFAKSAYPIIRRDLKSKPVYVAMDGARVLGFAAVYHRPEVWEIAWMGIDPSVHSGGIGARMIRIIGRDAKRRGVRLLEAKTISAKGRAPGFDRTRRFWAKVGFRVLEPSYKIPEWDPKNPCTILVKIL